MVIKRSQDLRGESAGGDQSASSMSKRRAGIISDFRNGSFWIEIRDTKLVPVDRCRCRSARSRAVRGLIASTDLWPQEMFTFLEMHAMVKRARSVRAWTCLLGWKLFRFGVIQKPGERAWVECMCVHGRSVGLHRGSRGPCQPLGQSSMCRLPLKSRLNVECFSWFGLSYDSAESADLPIQPHNQNNKQKSAWISSNRPGETRKAFFPRNENSVCKTSFRHSVSSPEVFCLGPGSTLTMSFTKIQPDSGCKTFLISPFVL